MQCDPSKTFAEQRVPPWERAGLAPARGSVCGEPVLPDNWGNIEVPKGVALRPLTEKDMAGYSEEEWQQVIESERRTQNEKAQRPGHSIGSDCK